MRECLDREGFHKVKIIVSSGFGPAKCRLMAEADAPVDVIGTGSYLPTKWTETSATADVVEYDGVPRGKVGREFLLRRQPASPITWAMTAHPASPSRELVHKLPLFERRDNPFHPPL